MKTQDSVNNFLLSKIASDPVEYLKKSFDDSKFCVLNKLFQSTLSIHHSGSMKHQVSLSIDRFKEVTELASCNNDDLMVFFDHNTPHLFHSGAKVDGNPRRIVKDNIEGVTYPASDLMEYYYRSKPFLPADFVFNADHIDFERLGEEWVKALRWHLTESKHMYETHEDEGSHFIFSIMSPRLMKDDKSMDVLIDFEMGNLVNLFDSKRSQGENGTFNEIIGRHYDVDFNGDVKQLLLDIHDKKASQQLSDINTMLFKLDSIE